MAYQNKFSAAATRQYCANNPKCFCGGINSKGKDGQPHISVTENQEQGKCFSCSGSFHKWNDEWVEDGSSNVEKKLMQSDRLHPKINGLI